MEKYIDEELKGALKVFIPDIETYLNDLEKRLEDEGIKLFSAINISSSVKTDKYSLPCINKVVVKLQRESYVNGMFEHHRVFRPIVKELFEKDVYKIRFYFHIETYADGGKNFKKDVIETKTENSGDGFLDIVLNNKNAKKAVEEYLDKGIKYSFIYFIHR